MSLLPEVGSPEYLALPWWRKIICWVFATAILVGCIALIVAGIWWGYQWWSDRDYRAAVAERECRMDSECWGDRHWVDAETACRPFVEQQARYRHEWTDGFGESKFPKWSFTELDGSSGMLVYEGSAVRFENGFGAWQRVYYSCYYDPRQETVVGVNVRPY